MAKTRREPYAVVPDTLKWEQSAACRLDTHDSARSFVKNEGLGFAIPYLRNGEHRDYPPDFIVRLSGDGERYPILETKGYDPLKEVKAQAADRWVEAIDADGRFGSWRYAMATDIGEVGEAVSRASG